MCEGNFMWNRTVGFCCGFLACFRDCTQNLRLRVFSFCDAVQNTVLCPIIVLKLELMPLWKHCGSFLHSVPVQFWSSLQALYCSSPHTTLGAQFWMAYALKRHFPYFSKCLVLFHEEICKFFFGLELHFKESTFNLVGDTYVCTCVRSEHEVYVCLCVVHKINYIIYSHVWLLFSGIWLSLTTSKVRLGSFCVQRGWLNYCGQHCSVRLVRLILCFNL